MKRCVVITGASRGIGLATARRFQTADTCVFSISRTPPAQAGIRHVFGDVTIPASIDAAADVILNREEDWDQTVLVHNAALHRHDTILDLEADDLLAVLTANLVAPQILNRRIIPRMKPGSSILYVGSTLSEKAVAGACSYVVGKHGIVGLMRATCQDLAGRGVHTACICPGFTDTEMLRSHIGDALDEVTAMVAAGRLVRPEEIAELLHVCAASPALNGAVLHANLGQIER